MRPAGGDVARAADVSFGLGPAVLADRACLDFDFFVDADLVGAAGRACPTSTGLRAWPVCDVSQAAISSGVPATTTRPPPRRLRGRGR